MKVIEEIGDLALMLHERGIEIAPFVIVGTDTFRKLHTHLMQRMCNPYADPSMGNKLTITTCVGSLDIKVDANKPADYIGINGTTLLDMVAEEALLGN